MDKIRELLKIQIEALEQQIAELQAELADYHKDLSELDRYTSAKYSPRKRKAN